MNIAANNIIKSKEILYVLFGITMGVMLVKSAYVALLVPLGLFTILLLSKSPLHALFVFVLFIPFSLTELFNTYLIDVPGARLINILGFLVLAGGIWHYKDSVKLPDYALFFITAIFFIFTIAVFRSLLYLDQLMELADDIRSTTGYLLSHFVKPMLFFIPLIVIIKFCRKIKHLEFVTNVLIFSLITLSLYLLFLFIFKAPDKNEFARDYIYSILKMHGNEIANFFIIAFPIVLAKYFTKKNLISTLPILLTIAAIGILYSRTAYLTLLLSFILYLFLSKRAKFLPIFLVGAIVLSLTVFTSVKERATQGFESKEYDVISGGRIEGIWKPLLDEYGRNPEKILIGNGRYAIKVSDSAKSGYLAGAAGHPHNMYIEQILDSGLPGLIIFVLFYIVLLKRTFRNLRKTSLPRFREYHYAVIVSLISFLIAGLTGRSFFPEAENSFVWIVLGIAIVINRMTENSGRLVEETT